MIESTAFRLKINETQNGKVYWLGDNNLCFNEKGNFTKSNIQLIPMMMKLYNFSYNDYEMLYYQVLCPSSSDY